MKCDLLRMILDVLLSKLSVYRSIVCATLRGSPFLPATGNCQLGTRKAATEAEAGNLEHINLILSMIYMENVNYRIEPTTQSQEDVRQRLSGRGTGYVRRYRVRMYQKWCTFALWCPCRRNALRLKWPAGAARESPVPFSFDGNDEEAAPGRAAPRRHSPCFSND